MTKGLWIYCPSPMFSKACTFLYFYILFFLTCSVFGTICLPFPICPFATFLIKPSPQARFHKSYPQFKTFLNIRAVPSSAVFCSNTVLITTPSSSMHFFSFFDVLPSAPTTTGMTVMLLMFHILLISLFSSWYLLIFSFPFSLTLMSPGIALSIIAQLLSFLFTATISGFLALIFLSHWILTSHKIFTFSFSPTPFGACSYHLLLLFRLYFSQNFQ